MEHTDFIEIYTNWIKANSAQRIVNGFTEITTPFLDAHNDAIQFYVQRKENDFFFTDDGYTISDLEMNGMNVLTGKRKDLLHSLATTMNIFIEKGAITAKASDTSHVAQTEHLMIQAMLKIGDMFLLSSSQVRGIFLDDVKDFFFQNNIRSTSSVLFSGKSGLPQHFDFVIPASKEMPERLVITINHPTRQNIQSAMFTWSDVKVTRREDSIGYIILNDKAHINSSLIDAVNHYEGMRAIPWSKRDEYRDALVA